MKRNTNPKKFPTEIKNDVVARNDCPTMLQQCNNLSGKLWNRTHVLLQHVLFLSKTEQALD